jgi:hypothetical protein
LWFHSFAAGVLGATFGFVKAFKLAERIVFLNRSSLGEEIGHEIFLHSTMEDYKLEKQTNSVISCSTD